MSAQSNAPIIIKRVKKGGGEGHHGGAWKVAYADFVTAMMAFFMLMWLLNATTEKQRKGIADYFSPTIPVNRVSGGGDGSFGGDSVFTEETLAQIGQGGLPGDPRYSAQAGVISEDEKAADAAALQQLEDALTARGGESMVSDLARRHIITRVTDEGLVIEIFDLEGEPIFAQGTSQPTKLLTDLTVMMARVLGLVQNDVAISGYVQSQPVVIAQNTGWHLSTSRADTVRRLLEDAEFPKNRVRRVTGHADRTPVARNPMAPRNNRVELTILRANRR